MQPTFISETEMPEIQKNENRNESQNNIELYKEFDCYKLFLFYLKLKYLIIFYQFSGSHLHSVNSILENEALKEASFPGEHA